MTTSPLHALRRAYGLARSAVIYRANPVKLRRARRFYRAIIKPGDLCFDIGAHLGDRADHFLKLGARVVAVEPQPLLFAALRRRFGGDPRVILVPVALGDAQGKAELAIDPMNPTVASLSPDFIAEAGRHEGFRHVRWRERVDVEVTTLDALIAAHGVPAFCKIDVEGYEHAVLDGLSHRLPALSLEYLPGALDPALGALARLNRLGVYRFNHSPGETMRFALPHTLGGAEMTKELKGLPHSAGSGDVYAFLDAAPSAR